VRVSEGQAAKVRDAGVSPDRIRVIRNATRLRPPVMDTNARDQLRRLAGGDGQIVVAAGRLSPEKGFRVLIDAARSVVASAPDARFVLFGDGVERPALEAQIAEAGLGSIFRMPGFRSDLDALIPWPEVVALASFAEGLPNVALEAAAAGVPVVATAVGGTPEVVITGQTGFLVPPGDAKPLGERILDLLRNPDWARHFGKAARQR